ncbi:MAG TPA: tyrosine-protein phosphatase [Acidimicrobiia bacterium]
MTLLGDLARAINLRDLGGLRVDGGGVTAPGRLYRSGRLDDLDLATRRDLIESLGITDVVDLRHRVGCYHGPAVTMHSLPLNALGTNPIVDPVDTYESVGEWYLRQLTLGAERLRRIVELVATSQGATLIHCHAGKDRTGSVVALILSAVGVVREDVVRDYALTGRVAGDRFLEALPPKFSEADPETMWSFFARLDAEYGSVPGFLESIGIEPETVRLLRGRLVVGCD